MSTTPIIKIDSLSVAFGEHRVLTNVSAAIEAGQRVAVVGRNGVGKSTLVRCLAGLEKVGDGTITIGGKDIVGYSPRELARWISYVPQGQGRIVPGTVYDYVMLGRFPYQGFMAIPSQRDREKVNEALELTDTAALAKRWVSTLSGGEMQRVLLAGSVAQGTRILLLDEPTTYLDPFHAELINTTLENVHREYGCTIVAVTHDINAALRYYSHILALVNGSVYCFDTHEQIRTRAPSVLESIYGIGFDRARCDDSHRAIYTVHG
jgi:iron complex transport system ATP-binding protein